MLVGDIMLSRNVAKSVKENGRDFTYPFAETAAILTQAEITFGNFFRAPHLRTRCRHQQQEISLQRAPGKYRRHHTQRLRSASFLQTTTCSTTAPSPCKTLWTSSRKTPSASWASSPGTRRKNPDPHPNGIRVAFLAYADHKTPYAYAKEFDAFETGPAKAVDEDIARDIAALKGQCDVIVVSLHWGIEYNANPDGRQQQLGRFLIDQGVSVVAGHHPHVLQEPEWYKDGIIIYSMGNFVFDQWSRPPTRISRIYRLTLDKGGLVDGDYLPLEIAAECVATPADPGSLVPIPLGGHTASHTGGSASHSASGGNRLRIASNRVPLAVMPCHSMEETEFSLPAALRTNADHTNSYGEH